jgi:hypothetical protein
MYCYYGSTDADVDDPNQYDFHSTQEECTATDETGSQGQWIPDPTTNMTVQANGGGSVDDDSFGFDGFLPQETFQHFEWQGDPDDTSLQLLSTAITDDVQNASGCIASAYGFGGVGEPLRYMGQPYGGLQNFINRKGTGLKPFISDDSVDTSIISDYLSSVWSKAQKGLRFPSLTGGPRTGKALGLKGTPKIGRALGRAAPFIGWALDAYAAVKLWRCL